MSQCHLLAMEKMSLNEISQWPSPLYRLGNDIQPAFGDSLISFVHSIQMSISSLVSTHVWPENTKEELSLQRIQEPPKFRIVPPKTPPIVLGAHEHFLLMNWSRGSGPASCLPWINNNDNFTVCSNSLLPPVHGDAHRSFWCPFFRLPSGTEPTWMKGTGKSHNPLKHQVHGRDRLSDFRIESCAWHTEKVLENTWYGTADLACCPCDKRELQDKAHPRADNYTENDKNHSKGNMFI